MIFDESMSRSYDDWFRSPAGRYIDFREKDLIRSLTKPRAGERLLDVGCGTGEHLLMFREKGCEVTGVDASRFMLDRGREKLGNRAELFESQAEDLPFADNEFDIVVAITSLEFVTNPGRVIAEAIRVCRDRVFLGILNPYSLLALQRCLEGCIRPTVYDQARLISVHKLMRMITAQLGPVPMTWGSVIFFPASWYPMSQGLEEALPVMKNPLGAFLGLSFPITFRFRTIQDVIREPYKMRANQRDPVRGAVREMKR